MIKLLDENYDARHEAYNTSMKEMLNTNNDNKTTQSKTKSPETYDRNKWWMVHGRITKILQPLRRQKISK